VTSPWIKRYKHLGTKSFLPNLFAISSTLTRASLSLNFWTTVSSLFNFFFYPGVFFSCGLNSHLLVTQFWFLVDFSTSYQVKIATRSTYKQLLLIWGRSSYFLNAYNFSPKLKSRCFLIYTRGNTFTDEFKTRRCNAMPISTNAQSKNNRLVIQFISIYRHINCHLT